MDEEEIEAILKWLGTPTPQLQDAERDAIRTRPLQFMEAHLDLLPPHLLALFAKVLSVRQRGQVGRIRVRRRHFAEVRRPAELSTVEARQREPLTFKQYMGRAELESREKSSSSKATTSSSSSSKIAPQVQAQRPLEVQQDVGKDQLKNVTKPEEVMQQPRFQSLIKRYDEEELLGNLRQQEEREAETVAEVESDSEEEDFSSKLDVEKGKFLDEDGDGDNKKDEAVEEQENEEAFQAHVLQRFVLGDPLLPVSLYACDFDDMWDSIEQESTKNNDLQGLDDRVRRVPERTTEDAWFDEEEES